jgi:hypothetical protein
MKEVYVFTEVRSQHTFKWAPCETIVEFFKLRVSRDQPNRKHGSLASLGRALDARQKKHGECKARVNATRAAARKRDELELEANRWLCRSQ